MSDDPLEKAWDEYDWERFLQQQEQRAEKYMGLLEKYMDHPQRDEIIAREMGWTHLIGGETREWEEEVEAGFEESGSGEDEDDEAGERREGEERRSSGCPVFPFEKHPLYSEAIAFTASLEQMFAGDPESVREDPAVAELGMQLTLTTAKLAAALNDSEVAELGMCIAYLKRALRALTAGLDAVVKLRDHSQIDEQRFELMRGKIFSIRDGIVTTMGEMRAEFRRRYGSR